MSSGAVKGQVKGQVKGLLKGLRYISQIFDEEDEKQQIEIGFPTDVKHLAHIGAENAKASQPSWLTEFKESSEGSSGTVVNPVKATPEGSNSDATSKGNNNSDATSKGNNSDATSKANNSDATSKGEGKRGRKSRPRSSENQSTMSSPSRESSTEGSKPSRRNQESSKKANRQSSEDEKPPTASKPRRKSKTSSEDKDGGSVRRSSEDKEGSSRRAPRGRRHSKGGSLTEFSFSESGPQ
ncbi:CRIB domain-containing protein RIC10-like [Vigna umbellata]|uniref:CRIB domain-containing protein RIC10-like n=1 Tax=Vigna umbellata TaxID=87088 RepID=UPI001F5F8031|nr:CRIB domain-containing protein RIC10-like [Vigna umbellata]